MSQTPADPRPPGAAYAACGVRRQSPPAGRLRVVQRLAAGAPRCAGFGSQRSVKLGINVGFATKAFGFPPT